MLSPRGRTHSLDSLSLQHLAAGMTLFPAHLRCWRQNLSLLQLYRSTSNSSTISPAGEDRGFPLPPTLEEGVELTWWKKVVRM